MRVLKVGDSYTRRDVHGIFSPNTTFTPQTGTWGLQGIVRVPERPGDFVFFVTFGARQGTHAFDEEITDDGVLTWQSQPSQRLADAMIQEFVAHNDLTNSIHLFLRTRKTDPYTYLGELGYLAHDPMREAPVHFTWQLMNWPPPVQALKDLSITPSPTETSQATPQSPGELTLTEPPPAPARPSGRGGGGGRKQAFLPGQDAKNRKLGLAGEHLVVGSEIRRLTEAGRADLAAKIVHVSIVEGDSAGYDVRSYNLDETVRHIEVKTTHGPAANAFFISPNEVRFSEDHPASYVIFRLYAYSHTTKSASYYEIAGPVTESFDLEPTEYRAKLTAADSDGPDDEDAV